LQIANDNYKISKDNEGEEWVDWYNPSKSQKIIIDLLTKIEENTRNK